MKRIWIAVGFLVILPFLIWLGARYTNNVTERMEQYVSAAKEDAESGRLKAARADIEHFESAWDEQRGALETFTRHAELDTLSNEASRLMPYLEKTEADGLPGADYFACCDSVVYQLRHIRDMERINWANLL